MAGATLAITEPEAPGEGLTAGLAKGVRMFTGALDLSEEGMGFGVPAVVSRWRTYLSRTAPVIEKSADGRVMRKVFYLDAVQQVAGSGADRIWPYLWLEAKGRIYKNLPWAQRWLLNQRATGNLTPAIAFAPAPPLAKVPVEYRLDAAGVHVSVDLRWIKDLPARSRVYILNEQGGQAFPRYYEFGEGITDRANGWSKVESAEAGFVSADGSAGFILAAVPGATMFHGREVVDNLLSWSGVEYDVSGWRGGDFSYHVDIKGFTKPGEATSA